MQPNRDDNGTDRGLPWFALKVRSQCEQVVSVALRCKGYEEFLPTYCTRRRWSDRIKEVQAPLFPGYVFCRLDIQDRLPVLTTPGVVYVVGLGRTPVPVLEAEMQAVQAIVNSNLFASPWPFLRVGEEVELVRGPLQGLSGILLKFKNKYRLVVSVTLLNRSVAVEVEGDWARNVNRTSYRLSESVTDIRCHERSRNGSTEWLQRGPGRSGQVSLPPLTVRGRR